MKKKNLSLYSPSGISKINNSVPSGHTVHYVENTGPLILQGSPFLLQVICWFCWRASRPRDSDVHAGGGRGGCRRKEKPSELTCLYHGFVSESSRAPIYVRSTSIFICPPLSTVPSFSTQVIVLFQRLLV